MYAFAQDKNRNLHMILKNGIPCDKLDVKGLDVVRSSFPKAFQDFMASLPLLK